MLVYLVPTWYVTHFPAGLRFVGDDSPVEGNLLVFAWVTFGLLVGGHAVAALWIRSWRPPSVHHGRGQRLARRLGLVE